jgi:hypothetical protein
MAKALVEDKPHGSWVQTERAAHGEWSRLTGKQPRASQILHILIEHMDNSNALVVSHATLCELSGLSASTVKRALAYLVQNKWIQAVRIGSERGGVLAYVVNSCVAWADKRDNLRLASFRAQVLVSSADEDNLTTDPLSPIPGMVAAPVEGNDPWHRKLAKPEKTKPQQEMFPPENADDPRRN